MLQRLLTFLGLTNADVRLFTSRHKDWPKVRASHLKLHPCCAACGRKDFLEVHHRMPVHLVPELELDPDNLVTLCEGPSVNCHLLFGHLGHWKSWNENVRQDAATWLMKRQHRP